MPPDGFYCKSCGYQLGDPTEDLHDPNVLSDVGKGIAEDIENPGQVLDNEETAHLVVRDGEKGWRYYCSETGETTKLLPHPPDDNNGEGEGGSPNAEQPKEPGPKVKDVYDVDEEKSQMSILAEVVTNPLFGLNEAQQQEIKDWAEDYDGRLPPDVLEDILKNFNGIQKQTAQLARQKYESKLNKWIRNQSKDDSGPTIGVGSPRPNPSGGGKSQPSRRQPPPESGQSSSETGSRSRQKTSPSDVNPTDRRARRIKRRNDVLDTAAETAAEEVADDVARELVDKLGLYVGLPGKIIQAKIEKDPDWALEKIEEWDIDLESIMEPSESRKDEMRQDSKAQADMEADEALNLTKEEQHQQTEPQMEPETMSGGKEPEKEETVTMKDTESEETGADGEEPFKEIFGGE